MRYKSVVYKKSNGYVLALTMLIIFALSSFSIAMLQIVRTNAKNIVKNQQINSVQQAAEYGLESGRLWLLDQMTRSGGDDPIVITNTQNTNITGDCLGLHGYTNTSLKVWYAYKRDLENFTVNTDTNFSRFSYEFYVQRVGNQSTIDGYNYIPQTTEGSDSLTVNSYNSRRIFYRVISCGYGPNNKIVPLQLFLSSGGDGSSGNVSRAINIEGFYRP